MNQESLEVSITLPATPEALYGGWLDSQIHSAFTGGASAQVDPRVGGEHQAWDGYIQGVTLELDPNRRIVQSWRTTEFPEGSPDSRLELTFEPAGASTKLTLRQTQIPEGQGEMYRQGWEEHYFTHMRRYFGEQGG